MKMTKMRAVRLLAGCVAIGWLGSIAVYSQPDSTGTAIYSGARLIIGDGSAPIEDGALVVQNGRIVAVGTRSAVTAPPGAARVDLTGKTVMPALVNAHAHIGYEKFAKAAGESRPEHFTPENILDHLLRQAYYGVGTVLDAGSAEIAIAQQFQRDYVARTFPLAAQLSLMAGVVPPDGGPDHILIRATRPLRANYEVTRSPEARAAVQAVAASNVKHLKIWLGDRNGTYPAMPREVYEAVIDEAHKLGITVHAHATNLRDQKDALRAGVDVLVHSIQGATFDDEMVALVRDKKPYWTTVMGLGDRPGMCENDPFFTHTLPPASVADIQANNCRTNPNPGAREENLEYNFSRMIESGARLVLGTDAGVFPRYTFGSADHHELARYVEMGLTPAQAIVAATSRPAALIGATDVGTLAAGKQADFLVLDANPLDDIRHTRRIGAVYLRGVMVDRAALRDRWKQASPSQ
jgi:imidazolonepropionase-like amidohydrolase